MFPPYPQPRLPNRGELLLVILVLGVLLAVAGAHIRRLQANPLVQESIVYRRVQGPTRTVVRTTTKPSGEVVVERERTVESSTVERDTEKKETARPLSKSRWAHATVDAAGPRAAAAGLTLWNTLDVGASYDWRSRAPGAVIGIRF
jgi:hypothetical protein